MRLHPRLWRLVFLISAIILLSGCLEPLTATPQPTQEVIRISLPPELTPLRQAIQVCAQAQPEMALFEETEETPSDLKFVLGEPNTIESYAAQIAREQILVIVHPQNPIQELSRADLVDIFTGRKTNWAELGGEDSQITLWTYPAGVSIRELFDRLVMGSYRTAGQAFLAPTPEAMREAVQQDPGAIGFVPAAWLDESIKPIEMDPEFNQALEQPVLVLSMHAPQGPARQLLACLQSGEGKKEILQKYPLSEPQE